MIRSIEIKIDGQDEPIRVYLNGGRYYPSQGSAEFPAFPPEALGAFLARMVATEAPAVPDADEARRYGCTVVRRCCGVCRDLGIVPREGGGLKICPECRRT